MYFLFFGIAFNIMMILVFCQLQQQKKRCTHAKTGTVIGYEVEQSYTPDTSHIHHYRNPVVEYEHDGIVYQTRPHIVIGKYNLQKGSNIALYLNPHNPKEAYVPAFRDNQKYAILEGIVLGVDLILIVAVLIFR